MWIISALLSLLAENLILTGALGTSTLMAATKNRSNLAILSLMMTLFSVLGCLLTSLLYQAFPMLTSITVFPVNYLAPLLYTAVISVIYIIVLLALYALGGKKRAAVTKYVHLSAFNCAVMGTLYLGFTPEQFVSDVQLPAEFLGMRLNSVYQLSPMASVLFGVQMGLGFVLASLMLLAVRKRLYAQEVPAMFRGYPAVLVYIGLLSMAVHAITV